MPEDCRQQWKRIITMKRNKKAVGIDSRRFFLTVISDRRTDYFLAITVPLINSITGLGSALVVTVMLFVNGPIAAAL